MRYQDDEWKVKRNDKAVKQHQERQNRERRREALEQADRYAKRLDYPARDEDEGYGF